MLKPCLTKTLVTVEQWLFPASCVLCGKAGEARRELCAACLADLPYNAVACARCASPLAAPMAHGTLCGQCLQTPPAYDASFSVFHYAPPVDHLIQRLKFSANLNLARLLGGLLADHLQQRNQTLPELLIPVPLHSSRLRARGFNQALEIARPMAGKLGIALDYKSAARTRPTAVQSLLPAKDRRSNVKGAFCLTGPISARHVAIVDDVMTTGHTVQEFASILRKAGVIRIEVWTVARAALYA